MYYICNMKSVLLFLIYLLFCTNLGISQNTPSFNFNESDSVIKYFHLVTKGSEYGTYNGYSKYYDDIKVYLIDKKDTVFKNELIKVIAELNFVLDSLNISIVNSAENANLIVHYKSQKDIREYHHYYDNFFKTMSTPNTIIAGLAKSSFYLESYSKPIKKIEKSVIWVSTEVSLSMMMHTLREEFAQSLGLYNDVGLYSNSIFYSGSSYPTQYSKLDLTIIDMLYNKVK